MQGEAGARERFWMDDQKKRNGLPCLLHKLAKVLKSPKKYQKVPKSPKRKVMAFAN